MRVKWHGHSCFEFISQGVSVIVDPHDGKSIGIKPPVSKAGIVLISHDHFDHNAQRAVKGEHAVLAAETGTKEVGGLTVECLPSFHDDKGGALRGANTIHKFAMEGITVCHCGDLGDVPSDEVVGAMRGVDILFVPTGEVYTLPIPRLRELIAAVDPKVVVPMHYRVGGLTIPLKTLDDFLEGVPEDTIVHVGNEVELSSDDIQEFSGVWVFDR
ncbi:MAG: MBL fold metallo-hydrolase [Methanomassiliicoccaceae archaeon]|nr:MBL fold metallo-hydrolase [Methanomassiliicoccaceae archaeon]